MERTILHSDANCFYASVEMLYHPEYAGKPLAVGGDPEARHGIVLTANYIAKRTAISILVLLILLIAQKIVMLYPKPKILSNP